MQPTHYKMITDKKIYLVQLEDESSEKDYHGWYTYKVWNDVKGIWITAPKGFPRYVREDYRMYAGGEHFTILRLSFKNKFDFKWIEQHNITCALFE